MSPQLEQTSVRKLQLFCACDLWVYGAFTYHAFRCVYLVFLSLFYVSICPETMWL